MIKKEFIILVLFLFSLMTSAYVKPEVYKIDAQKNATVHNNLGIIAVSEKNYFVAIQEFSIAIALNPNSQATSIYYNNLGEAYMKVGYYKEAQSCFERAISRNRLIFLFYQNLVNSYKLQKTIGSNIKKLESSGSKNSLNMVTLGLLYVANGDIRRGIIKLDEFCMQEPDLIITDAVRAYIKSIIPQD